MEKIKISELDATTTAGDNDVLPLVQSGVTKKITKADLLKEIRTDFDEHADDASIHYPQSEISITESQVSDLDKYTQEEINTALSDKANTNHNHAISDITSLADELSGKAPTSHSHAIPDVTGLNDALGAKADDNAVVKLTEKGQANGVASLDETGKVPTEQLPESGGGGQILFDAVVAPSGGDYTTVSAAVADGKRRIFVRAGTYQENGTLLTSIGADHLTVVGEDVGTVILNCNTVHGVSYMFFFSGSGLFRNITFTGTQSARALIGITNRTEGNLIFENCELLGSSRYQLYTNITDNDQITGFINCSFVGSNDASSNGVFDLQGFSHSFITNCYIKENRNDNFFLLRVGGRGWRISNNTFRTHQRDYQTLAGEWGVFADNTIYNVGSFNSRRALNITGQFLTVTGNTYIASANSTNGFNIVEVSGHYNTVDGNSFFRADDSVMTANSWINVTGNRNQVSNNNLGRIDAITAPIINTGVGNNIFNNKGANEVGEVRIKRMKNTSGGSLAIGDLVVLKDVANGNEITTTTTAGSNKVYGVVVETIANNAWGYIQTLGKTTTLKADGTTDIAIGDFLSTFTTAGIAQKASSGHTAIAIALEAYTADNSSGVLDALIINPRLI